MCPRNNKSTNEIAGVGAVRVRPLSNAEASTTQTHIQSRGFDSNLNLVFVWRDRRHGAHHKWSFRFLLH